MKAVWKDTIIAESDDTTVIEGNHYFPPEALHRQYFQPSDYRTVCGWKGEASYFDVVVDGARNEAAAWYYPEPLPAARNIKDRVAFWRGVRVEA